MKKVCKGITEYNLICFKEKLGLPIGTEAIVTLKTVKKEKQRNIKERQLRLLDKCYNLGKKYYVTRDDIYAR